MDIRGLRYFVGVVRHGGFSRASAALHVTQPALSKAVRQLEDELKAPLLIREPKGVRVTEVGALLHARATAILAQVASLATEVAEIRQLTRGRLDIGMPPVIGSAFFGRIVHEFRLRYPGIELQIAEYGTKRLEQALLESEVEVAAALMPVDVAQFEAIPFVADRVVLVVPREDPLARRREVALSELAEQSFILFPPEYRIADEIDAAFRHCGFTPNVAGRSANWDFVVAMVAAGLGIALLPEAICQRVPTEVAVVPVTAPEIRYEVALIRRRGGYLSRGARAWIDVAREVRGLPKGGTGQGEPLGTEEHVER